MTFRLPTGTGLLLVGSGVYWALSSQLIGSPTALAPGLLNGPSETALLAVGLGCVIGGFPLLVSDSRKLRTLFERRDGWLFTIPLGLAAADIELTLIGLSTGRAVELNPFVRSATIAGPLTLLLFLLSYMGLSEGLGVLMLGFGRKIYGVSRAEKYLPYALVCGTAAFGPFSNFALILVGPLPPVAGYAVGIAGSGLLSYGTYARLKKMSPKTI